MVQQAHLQERSADMALSSAALTCPAAPQHHRQRGAPPRTLARSCRVRIHCTAGWAGQAGMKTPAAVRQHHGRLQSAAQQLPTLPQNIMHSAQQQHPSVTGNSPPENAPARVLGPAQVPQVPHAFTFTICINRQQSRWHLSVFRSASLLQVPHTLTFTIRNNRQHPRSPECLPVRLLVAPHRPASHAHIVHTLLGERSVAESATHTC